MVNDRLCTKCTGGRVRKGYEHVECIRDGLESGSN